MCVSADCHEAIFSGQSQVRNRDRELVIEDSCCVRKTDSVLRQVGSSFARIPLSLHGNNICILYAYVKESRAANKRDIIPDKRRDPSCRWKQLNLRCLSAYVVAQEGRCLPKSQSVTRNRIPQAHTESWTGCNVSPDRVQRDVLDASLVHVFFLAFALLILSIGCVLKLMSQAYSRE